MTRKVLIVLLTAGLALKYTVTTTRKVRMMKLLTHTLGVSLLLLCGCGYCISQCALLANCEERDFDEFESYDETLSKWRDEASTDPAPNLWFVLAGACANDRVVLHRDEGLTTVTYYYDAGDGSFLGMKSTGDVFGPPCWATAYWPRPIECTDPIITEIIPGDPPYGLRGPPDDPYEVGDEYPYF